MFSKLTILVSGASGDIGTSLGRILKKEGFNKIIGCDISTDSAALCVFDDVIKIVKANSDIYLDELKCIFEKYNISLFIPSSEAEIEVIHDKGLTNGCLFNIPVIILDKQTVSLSLDKYKTAEFLKNNNLNYPWTKLLDQNAHIKYPCIYKKRKGQGSKGLYKLFNHKDFEEIGFKQNYIFQELLLPDSQEYTCGVYQDNENLRVIVFKRELTGGFTGKGEVVDNKEIDNYIKQIAILLKFNGSANFQLRLTSKGPILFEINPRFSSTVMFRHKLGFKDLIWAIENRLKLKVSSYIKPKTGVIFYKGYTEYFYK